MFNLSDSISEGFVDPLRLTRQEKGFLMEASAYGGPQNDKTLFKALLLYGGDDNPLNISLGLYPITFS